MHAPEAGHSLLAFINCCVCINIVNTSTWIAVASPVSGSSRDIYAGCPEILRKGKVTGAFFFFAVRERTAKRRILYGLNPIGTTVRDQSNVSCELQWTSTNSAFLVMLVGAGWSYFNLEPLVVVLCTTSFNVQNFYILHLCVTYGSYNTQQLFPYSTLTCWFL